MATKQKATVSGGPIDRAYDSAPVALSAAINLAQKHGATMYVREADGSPYGRVEVDAGRVLIYAKGERS